MAVDIPEILKSQPLTRLAIDEFIIRRCYI